jgi:hypothetical protein
MVQSKFLCSLGNCGNCTMQKRRAQLEVSSASQQEDKTNNDSPPHCVVIPGSKHQSRSEYKNEVPIKS